MGFFREGDYLQIASRQGEGQPLATHLPSYHGYFMGNHVSPGEEKIQTNDKTLSSTGGCRRFFFGGFFYSFFDSFFILVFNLFHFFYSFFSGHFSFVFRVGPLGKHPHSKNFSEFLPND